MNEAIFHFPTEGTPLRCTPIGMGHIHQTFCVQTDTGARYILQRMNRYVFPDAEAIMSNLAMLAASLDENETRILRYLDAREGGKLYDDGDSLWRAYPFVPNSICLGRGEGPEELYQGARAFGEFLHAFRGFPAAKLTETIPGFHDTPLRYRQLREALAADPRGRRAEVEAEIAFFLEREERACRLQQLREQGNLPVRVTHNDAKLNNVLVDVHTGKAICVIDLDTVMPGLAACDFGDLVRSGASAADEDSSGSVCLEPERYRALLRGFLSGCPSLTGAERDSLPLGAYTMTLECGIRFLTDYLNGDTYFSIVREKHNLDRARNHMRLAVELEKNRDVLYRILTEEVNII